MLCLFGSPYLPVISNRDPFLVPLLVREAHVIICNGKKIHLTPELTINRLIGSSLAAVYIVDMKRTVTNAIKNCIHCNKKKAAKGRYRSFVHELGDPIMVSHMEESNLDVGFFKKISIDSLEVPVRTRAGQRGAATHKVGVLFGVCTQTGFFFTTVLDSLSVSNILSALQIVFVKYARPQIIITDNFSSFNALKKANPWIDVEIVVRQTAHQFGNPVEASIKLFKQMMPNICQSNLTGFELALEMELISATLNTRPFKRIVRETNSITLSPKAKIFPIMSTGLGKQTTTLEIA